MTKLFNNKSLDAFKKLGTVAIITATTLMLAMFFTACKQTSGGGKPKHEVTFSVEGENGGLYAKVDGMAETDKSPITVEEGKTVTFTAKANDGYRVKEWKVNSKVVAGNTSDTYTHTVTKTVEVKVSFELSPIEGGAVLILSPDHLTIGVVAKTADGSAITVEGCNETTLTSDVETTLNATGTRVVLKGKIIELKCDYNQLTELNVQGLTALQMLECDYNQLTELNVQGLTALQELECHSNKINAEEMTKLLNALPTREASDGAKAVLYTEQSGVTEGNCKDFTQSEDLKKAFEGAKSRKWNLQKINASGKYEDI